MLFRLNPDPNVIVPVQQDTSLSHDVMGRWFCNTLDEIQRGNSNSGLPFDVVVIGAGMHGGYIAEKLYRFGEPIGLRVLVLDAGAFLVPSHLQNLPRLGLGAPGAVTVQTNMGSNPNPDPGTQNIVWGFPWHSFQPFPGLAYCTGGRSLFWGGWAPRLTPADLDPAVWPQTAIDYFNRPDDPLDPGGYQGVEREIGVNPPTLYLSNSLFAALQQAFQAAAPANYEIGVAPLAIQGQSPAGGVFPFDKYSSAYLLTNAIREDVDRRGRGTDNSFRRLMLLPRTQVVNLRTAGGRIHGIDTYVNGQFQAFDPPLISPNCIVVLALSTIESTRLALESFPRAPMGANLMAHLRSDLTVRIRRSAIPSLSARPAALEAAALIVRGTTSNGRRFHFQVTAADNAVGDPELHQFAAIPDLDLLDNIRANQDPNWVVLTLRSLGEMVGDKVSLPGSDPGKSWVNLTDLNPNQRDPLTQKRRAWVNLVPTLDDNTAWDDMERRALDLVQTMAGGAGNIQYWYNSVWNNDPPRFSWDNTLPKVTFNTGRNLIGTTHHESGTLWMGTDPTRSVTNEDGRFHHVDNAYVAGPALHPTAGSANPTLTALTLARRTAEQIIVRLTPPPSPAFKALFTGTLDGWQMAGPGGFLNLFGSILEAQGGIGLLWYTREVFRNFVLRVEWLSFNPLPTNAGPVPPNSDNSGVFIRFPALNASSFSDPVFNDARLADVQGYEIQIDDAGWNPDTKQRGDASHQTGAVYALAPSSPLASKPAGNWNTYEIEANGPRIRVTLNGILVTDYTNDGSRPLEGHVGLQNHTGKVQFRNIMIRSLPG
jgi:choline dehydrogenase-like flavoprotein